MKPETICQTCGAKIVEYRHSLGRGIIQSLLKFVDRDHCMKPINLQETALTKNQWTNFQKLRYWQLVEKTPGQRGKWNLTLKGLNFLMGEIAVYQTAITYRAKLQWFDGSLITIKDVAPGYTYKQREEYAADAEPHQLGPSENLFSGVK